MENTTNFDIVVKDAFYVTKDVIVPTKVFLMKKAGSYGTTNKTYYLTEKGWQGANEWSDSKEIAYTQEEAEEIKIAKMKTHLEYLKKNKQETEDNISKIEAELSK